MITEIHTEEAFRKEIATREGRAMFISEAQSAKE